MDKKILIVNGGSSSLKFQVLKAHNKELIASGMAERIEIDGIFTIKVNGKKFTTEKTLNNHKDAITLLMEELKDKNIIGDWHELIGIGHRVVQGGEIFKKSSLIKEKELKQIRELSKLAPLHNPGEADIIEAFMILLPNVPNVAAFDTSFHQTMEKEEFMYAVPKEWYTKYGVRRYGMHGTSHKYITQHMEEHLNKNKVNLIICHLGNGSSLSAIRNSKVVNTSMGLTPLAGLIMGTRSGDLDPAIVSYMSEQLKKDANEIVDLLNHESGLKALSGISSDMRDIRGAADKGDERAQFTIKSFARRIATYIVDYANQIGETIDGIVFTAGIGENSKEIRKAIVDEIKILGLKICDERNMKKYEDILLISQDSSQIPLFAVRTNEEIMIANDLLEFIK